ncbi:glycosyltransferase family 4 protein [Lasiosphaeria ovina]|uniref:Alpha-1,3/1,6-mannosyltransferase ALG2 n=1 Tax=Lasiosphaeria ovina TaxID=92902 RepID=A0AAE0K907_9PEZI|nr:glycosyltransferase family 4 protein [Lasiosphaeria ovina]
MAPAPRRKRTIVFLHPDLGIGGAERLVVDAAVGLQKRGHRVVVFTSHCDPRHCFDEARDGTLDVRVRGHWLVPPSLLGRFAILCAIARQLHLILSIALLTRELRDLGPDVAFFADQLSAGLPLLKTLPAARRAPVFFYCHFPDLLLATGRARWWKRAYRLPFDCLEQWSMAWADAIAVNSAFTRGVVARTWPALARRRDLKVVYPCIDTTTTATKSDHDHDHDHDHDEPPDVLPWKESGVILSINRFERKKNIALAIRAFAGLTPEQRRGRRGEGRQNKAGGKAGVVDGARLLIAGGYDPRVGENVAYHAELCALAGSLGLSHATATTVVGALGVPGDVQVVFLLSVPNALKEMLLRSARLLVYTPANEHFGIVPLEAMLRGVPVLAADSGGPVETVVDGSTGWLRDPADVPAWTEVMDRALNRLSPAELADMGRAGESRVRDNFADVQMAERLDAIFDDMAAAKTDGPAALSPAVVALCLAALAALVGFIASRLGPRI